MALDELPKDIAGYLKRFEGDLQRLPTWDEREDLARRAIYDANAARSLATWDFFFVNELEIAGPIRRKVAGLRQHQRTLSDQLFIESRKFRFTFLPATWSIFLLACAAMTISLLDSSLRTGNGWSPALLLIFILSFACAYISVIALVLGPFPGSFVLRIISYLGRKLSRQQAKLVKQISQIDSQAKELEQYWEELKKQLPSPPQPELVTKWLEEGLDRVKKDAVREAVMHSRELQIEKAIKSEPLLTPAVYQEDSLGIFAGNPNIQKRVKASRWINPPNAFKPMPIFCIYKVDIIWPAEDMLTTYSCYYDLIADAVTYESQTEQYLLDVVAISIVYDDQEVLLPDGQLISRKRVPCLTISLSSGETRRFVFNDSNKMTYQLGKREYTVDADSGHNAIKAIRDQLRKRKVK